MITDLFQFSQSEVLGLFLVLVRISAFIVAWPVLSGEFIAPSIKILLSLVLSLMLYPIAKGQGLDSFVQTEVIVWVTIREAFIGLSLGYLARFFFFAVRIAGEIMSVSIGFSGAQIFNPMMGEQNTPLDQLYWIFASMFFLAINGHHLLLSGLADSFSILPIHSQALSLSAFLHVDKLFQEITIMGIKMAAPVMTAILFMNVTMAIVGRAVPQINVLITSLPVNILTGFAIMIVATPTMILQMDGMAETTALRLFQIMRSY